MQPFTPLTITAVTRETPDAVSVTFDIPASQRAGWAFKPGQHVNLRAVIDDSPVERSYSICSDPADKGLRIAIKRIPGGHFSSWANRALHPGLTLDVSRPQGRFVLRPGTGAPRHILGLAAGAGITPIISMVRHALATEPSTRVTLVYGNRTLDDVIFGTELEDLKDRHLDRLNLLHVLSRGDIPDTPLLQGRVDAAKVTALAERLFRPADVAAAYVCGPGSMIKDVRTALFAAGMSREKVHHEFFAAGGGAYRAGSPAPAEAIPPATPALTAELTVMLDGARHRLEARPGETIMDAALRAGLRAPFSCKGGMCCTCRAKIVSGSAQMRVNYSLEPWELDKGFILTCQAVPTSQHVAVDYDEM